ncbi:MAG: hypothetical protein QW292_14885 [Candidatus Parvarchaeota archaeon]
MSRGTVTTKLFPFQEPYREYYGKKVRIFRHSGSSITGELLSPHFSILPPAHKLYLVTKSKKITRISMDNIQRIEIIGDTGKTLPKLIEEELVK